MCESCNIGEFGVLERACCLSSSGSFAIFLVCSDVKEDEEDEVGGDRDDTGESGKFFSCAFARVGHPRPVGGGEVCVGCKVDEAWRDNKLESDLREIVIIEGCIPISITNWRI